MNASKSLRTALIYAFPVTLLSFTYMSPNMGHCQQLETREIKVEVSSTGAEARNEAFNKATEKLSLELATSRLGSDFLQSNRKKFDTEVIGKSSKYILSVRSKGVEGSVAKVELGFSMDAFDRVLRESGLMQLSRQNLSAVLFIEDKDQAIGSGPWWVKEKGEMKPSALELFKGLSANLAARGIEVVSLNKVRENFPEELRKANLNREELVQLGHRFNASLVYFGLVSPGSQGQIYHGQWVQVPASRILDEVQGESAKKPEMIEAIMAPVKDAQALGTLNTKPFRLTIQGKVTPKQLESLREQMRSGVRDLRSMKAREVKFQEFTFEAESPQTPKALADIIKTLSFQDFQHRVSLNGEDEILLRVEKR